MRKIFAGAFLSVALLITGAANAQQLGAYRGAGDGGARGMLVTEAWLGHPVPRALDFLSFRNWSGCNTTDSACSLSGWSIGGWAGKPWAVTFSVPLTLSGTPLSQIAAGAHDDAYTVIAQKLVAANRGDSIIRLGWEFNGGWYAWAAKTDPVNFVAAWRHVVQVMRAVPGTAFRFDWNPAFGVQQIAAEQVYPGDDVVDIIGLDVYNQYWGADYLTITPQNRWTHYLNDSHGLNWFAAFARAHGKSMSVPEWGTGTRPDGHGGGDDPYFVTQMAAWMVANNITYQNYWDFPASDYNGVLSNGSQPLAGAAFKAAFPAALPPPPPPPPPPTDPELVALRQQADAIRAARDAVAAASAASEAAAAQLKAALGGL